MLKKPTKKHTLLLYTASVIISLAILVYTIPILKHDLYFKYHYSKNKILSRCIDHTHPDTCYTDQFIQITKNYGIKPALNTLSNLQSDPAFAQDCHFIAHVIASEAVAKTPHHWESVVPQLPIEKCTGGYIMGIIEGQQHAHHTKLDAQTIPILCEKASGTSKKIKSCSHIIGHLLLVDTNGKIDPALDTCSQLPINYIFECQAGIFMENILRRNLVAHGITNRFPWNQETYQQQHGLCLNYTGSTALACWRELSHIIVYISKGNPQKTYDLCAHAPNSIFQQDCYIHSVGLITQTPSITQSDLANLCRPYQDDRTLHKRCTNMASRTINASVPHLIKDKPYLCRNLTGQDKIICNATIQSH